MHNKLFLAPTFDHKAWKKCAFKVTRTSWTLPFFNTYLYSLRIESTKNGFNNSHLYIIFSTYTEKIFCIFFFLNIIRWLKWFLFAFVPLDVWKTSGVCWQLSLSGSAWPLPLHPVSQLFALSPHSHFAFRLSLDGKKRRQVRCQVICNVNLLRLWADLSFDEKIV